MDHWRVIEVFIAGLLLFGGGFSFIDNKYASKEVMERLERKVDAIYNAVIQGKDTK